ncbi:MAG: hypothetical protein ABJH98_13705 [Reichenbachiella sp.]|uniref:hypothetical protein n=1 Tax=Reichenbachiella sp. TaxID=2184521 RepID=UPI0032998173
MATLDNRILFLGWVLLCGLTQCGTDDISKSFGSDQANRLLSADDTKAWSLFARTEDGTNVFNDCLEGNTLTFINETSEDSLYMLGRKVNCGSSSSTDTLYKAKYTLDADANETFQNLISLTDESFETIESIQVEELTSMLLKISYTVDGKAIEERYAH